MDIESVDKAFVMVQSATHTAAQQIAAKQGTKAWETLKGLDEALSLLSEALQKAFEPKPNPCDCEEKKEKTPEEAK